MNEENKTGLTEADKTVAESESATSDLGNTVSEGESTAPKADEKAAEDEGSVSKADKKATEAEGTVTEASEEAEEIDTASLAEQIFGKTGKSREKEPKKKRGMVKKQKIMIISFSALAVVLILLYFIFLLPYMKKLSEKAPTEPPEVLAGEVYDAAKNSLLIFPHVEKNKIQSIEIHNSYGSFTCVKEADDVFYIKEHLLAPLGNEVMSSLAVDAGYTVVSRRITTSCEDFSKYGLAEADNPAYYVLTSTSGEKHTVYLGNYTPNGSGIYCRYKDRNALYVVPSSASSTLLVGAEALITPMLMAPLPNAAYAQTDQFIITKNGQPFVEILYDNMCSKCGGKNKELENEKIYQCEKCGAKTPVDQYRASAYKMTYPANHIVNDTSYSSNVLLSLASLKGDRVLKAGSGEIGKRLCDDEALMAEYGFHDFTNVPYRLLYVYGDQSGAVAFAPSGIDGYYFAYSYEFDMIVLVQKETVPYLEWDIRGFISSSVFAENITEVTDITVKTAEGSYLSYNGKSYTINEHFTIKYVQGESENKLICKTSTGKEYDKTSPEFNYVQGFYGSLLSMYIEGYSDKTNPAELKKYAEIAVKKKDGTELNYAFYMIGERCFYTFNGSGEFYIPAYQVKRVLVNAVRAALGEPVNDSQTAPEMPESYLPVQ